MRAVSLVKGGQDRVGRDVARSAAYVVLCLICVALVLLVEACCG